MIVSVAILTAKRGHEGQVVDVLNDYVTKEKNLQGCIRVYYKRAINNDDTFMVYSEYDNKEHFEAAQKAAHHQDKDKGVENVLHPHIVKGFYGNFD